MKRCYNLILAIFLPISVAKADHISAVKDLNTNSVKIRTAYSLCRLSSQMAHIAVVDEMQHMTTKEKRIVKVDAALKCRSDLQAQIKSIALSLRAEFGDDQAKLLSIREWYLRSGALIRSMTRDYDDPNTTLTNNLDEEYYKLVQTLDY